MSHQRAGESRGQSAGFLANDPPGRARNRTMNTEHINFRFARASAVTGLLLVIALLLAACTAPIGADRVSTRLVYSLAAANALRTGEFSAPTIAVLHRFSLDDLAARHPDQAVGRLHEKALANGERDLLFALAELSYVAGDEIRRSLKPWDPRDARD